MSLSSGFGFFSWSNPPPPVSANNIFRSLFPAKFDNFFLPRIHPKSLKKRRSADGGFVSVCACRMPANLCRKTRTRFSFFLFFSPWQMSFSSSEELFLRRAEQLFNWSALNLSFFENIVYIFDKTFHTGSKGSRIGHHALKTFCYSTVLQHNLRSLVLSSNVQKTIEKYSFLVLLCTDSHWYHSFRRQRQGEKKEEL